MDRKPKNIMLKAYDFSDVLLLKRRFYLVCHHPWSGHCSEFGTWRFEAAIRTIIIIIISPGHSTYCYTELAASFVNFLHYCLPSSGFYAAEKDNSDRDTKNLSGHHPIRTTSAPTAVIPPSLCRMPFLPRPSQCILAWDRHQIMLACIPGGLFSL